MAEGLLDWFKTPEGKGLLSMVAVGMAGEQKGQPINNIGRGAVGGLQGYGTAQDRQARGTEAADAKKLRDMQLTQLTGQMADQQAAKSWQAGLPGAMGQTTDQGQQLLDQNKEFGAEGLQSLNESSKFARPDAPLNVGGQPQDLQKYLMQPGSPVAMDILKNQYAPKKELPPNLVREHAAAVAGGYQGKLEDFKAIGPTMSAATTTRGQDLTDTRAREFNAIKTEENQIKREEKQAVKDAATASQVASFDTMIGTLDRLGAHKGLARSVGAIGALPTMPGSESANFQAELETFQSQAFLPMVSQLKGMGALSDAEGKKITNAVGALNPKMGETAFRESVGRITADMNAARDRLLGNAPAAPTAPPLPAFDNNEYLKAMSKATPEQKILINARKKEMLGR